MRWFLRQLYWVLPTLLLVGNSFADSRQTPPASRYRSNRNPNRGTPTNLPAAYATQEWITAASLTPPATVSTAVRWIPWFTLNSTVYGYRADKLTVRCTRGTAMTIRPFGPNYDSADAGQDIMLSADADSSKVWDAPSPVDSLWIWDTGGTTSRCLIAAR